MNGPDDLFSADPESGLVALLDTLIPRSEDGALPAAGRAGVPAYLALHAADLGPLLRAVLAALDALAAERGAADFASLEPPERAAVVARHAERDPLWLPALLFHTCAGYYQQEAVLAALGLPYRPPFPEGYALEPTDPSLLDGVRQRPRLYREA